MRIWLSIRVELIQGGGRALWPRPGRVFAAARSHTFLALGDAIDTAFARWDRAHLSLFELADATDVCGPIQWEDPPEGSVFAGATRLSRLNAGEQFLYTFDMGDDWTHLCTVAEQRIDALEALGIIPDRPLPLRDPRPVRPAQRSGRRRDRAAARPAVRRPSTAAPLVGRTVTARALLRASTLGLGSSARDRKTTRSYSAPSAMPSKRTTAMPSGPVRSPRPVPRRRAGARTSSHRRSCCSSVTASSPSRPARRGRG